MDREVRRPFLPLPVFPSWCVCTEPCVQGGGLSGGGPIRSSGVLCIVTAASGSCVCVSVSVRVSVLTRIIFTDIKS